MENNSAYILTSEHNDYDQHGEYFIAYFHKYPNEAEISEAVVASEDYRPEQSEVEHIFSGGGRRNWENHWFYLREVNSSNSK